MKQVVRLACAGAFAAILSTPASAQFGEALKRLLPGAAAGAATNAAAGAVAGGADSAPAQPGAAAPQALPPPPTSAELQAILEAPPAPLEGLPDFTGNLALRGKKFAIAEYRVLFEIGGKVTASTRAAYFGGIDRGATRMTVTYQVTQPNLELMQAITDRAWADFQAQLAAAGLQPAPAEAFVQEHGLVYTPTNEATRPGAEVVEEVELGYGTRRYLVFAPRGMRLLSRGFAGLGAGDIGKRIEHSKGNLETLSVGMVVNVAAQESSGSGSSMFRRGSSADASAAMEVGTPHRSFGILHALASSQAVGMPAPVPVPGQFAMFRETGGYDSSKDALVKGIQVLGALTMGVAGNNSKRVEMAVDVDQAALARQVLQGLSAVHRASIRAIR